MIWPNSSGKPRCLPEWRRNNKMKDLSLESFNDIYRMLPCGRISDHPLRLDFYSQLRLKELEQSISLNGLLEPLIVYEVTKGRFVILSGHYRIRAMRRLKEKHVLCRIICCDKNSSRYLLCRKLHDPGPKCNGGGSHHIRSFEK